MTTLAPESIKIVYVRESFPLEIETCSIENAPFDVALDILARLAEVSPELSKRMKRGDFDVNS